MGAIQNTGLRIDSHAAHGVMHTGGDADRVEWPFVDRRTQRSGATKIIIVLLFNKPVIAFKRRQERVVIHTQRLRQRFRRAGAGHQAFGDVFIGSFVFCPNVLIKNDVRVFLRQRDNVS
ncbi:hypothetical protein D3C78_726960 [compost metagenome]